MKTKSSRHELSESALHLIAERFRVLGEPHRLKLITALEGGPRNVTDLVRATGTTQANVSRHLQALTRAGLLSRRKAGLNVYYAIAEPQIFRMCEHVCGSLRHQLAARMDAMGG